MPEPIVFAFLGINASASHSRITVFIARVVVCVVCFVIFFPLVLTTCRRRTLDGQMVRFLGDIQGMCSSFKCRVNDISRMGMTLKIKIIDKKPTNSNGTDKNVLSKQAE